MNPVGNLPSRLKTAIPVLGLLLVACSNRPPLHEERALHEAKSLKTYCANRQITGPMVRAADSLMRVSEARRQAQEKRALEPAEEAVIRYRLAISARELEEADGEVKRLEEALAKDREMLSTYQEVLNEVRAKRVH